MKICSPQLGVSPLSSLGGEIYDWQTLKGFTERGIEVYAYLPKDRHYDTRLKNFHVTYAPIKHIVPPWLFSFICLPYLFRTYGEEKFDILRIHSPRYLGPAAIIFHLFHPEVPILASHVTVDPPPLYYPVEWLTFKIARKIIVQSQYLKSILIEKYGVFPDKIAVTYGGQLAAQKENAETFPRLKTLEPSTPVVLFMGVLVKRKNPLFLVDVLKESKKEIPDLKLVVIGDGPMKNALVKKLKSEDLTSDAILIDQAYGAEKSYWFKRMDIFLLPSFDEGFGLSATEAMSFAKPVIASDRAAFSEIITSGKDGYTLPLNASLWCQKIFKLLKNPNRANAIGRSAKKTVEGKFSWKKTYDLNLQVAKSMIK